MRIIQITPGTGDNFYCENCLRDNELVKGLRALGHDALMVPLYLPPTTDGQATEATAPIFFGGINVYLQQKLRLFRKTPRWLDSLLDARWLLKLVSRRVGMTDATDLAETTISMLRGEDGRQRKELERLTGWLLANSRADVVCLSNSLLMGMARRIKEALRAPVICMLQDEDEFLDELPEPHRGRAWETLRQRAADIDAFVAPSACFGAVMARRLDISADRIDVVYNGISPGMFEPAELPTDPPVIGFLSRMCHGKGLDILVKAFVILKQSDRLKGARLRVAGGKLMADEPYVSGIQMDLAERGLASDVEFLPNLQQEDRAAFLRSLSVLSVPARKGTSAGRCVLEALATGVPVIQPRSGAFPELLEATGGGLLCDPENAEDLAGAIEKLLLDPAHAAELGRRGRDTVLKEFALKQAVQRMLHVCTKVVNETGTAADHSGTPSDESSPGRRQC